MPLLFYLFTFVINLWHWKFVTADVSLQCLRRGQNFHKKCVFEGVHSKKMTDEFLAKSWTKHGVNKVFKKLRDTGTVERRSGSNRPRSARTQENAKLLLQKYPRSLPLTLFYQLSGKVTENTFLPGKKTKSVAY